MEGLLISQRRAGVNVPKGSGECVKQCCLPMEVYAVHSTMHPSRHSKDSPHFRSPFVDMSVTLTDSTKSSPAGSLIPVHRISKYSTCMFDIVRKVPEGMTSSTALPRSIVVPFTLLVECPGGE